MPDFQIIKVPQFIPKLLEVCPEFQAQWNEHLKYWGDKAPGDYIDIAKSSLMGVVREENRSKGAEN